jgi:hypothetical protein
MSNTNWSVHLELEQAAARRGRGDENSYQSNRIMYGRACNELDFAVRRCLMIGFSLRIELSPIESSIVVVDKFGHESTKFRTDEFYDAILAARFRADVMREAYLIHKKEG